MSTLFKKSGLLNLLLYLFLTYPICASNNDLEFSNPEKKQSVSNFKNSSYSSSASPQEEDPLRYFKNQSKEFLLINGINLDSLRMFLNASGMKNFPPITVIDVIPNMTSNVAHIRERLIYGHDISYNLESNPHAERVLEEILNIAPNAKILITRIPELMIKFNSNIINLSIGLDDNTPINGDTTIDFLNELFRKNPKFFMVNFMNYLSGKFNSKELAISKKYETLDEYFLNKNKNLIIKISKKGIHATEGFKPLLNKKIAKETQKSKAYLTSICLNNEFLVVQSLSNKEGILNFQNCSFNDVEPDNFKRNYIIFVKSLYYSSKKSEIILPPSEIPGKQFCDRTICVVLPVDEDQGLPDELVFGISNNSQAAPWISACAHYLNVLCVKQNRRSFSPVKLAEYILEGASPKFLEDHTDEVLLNGKIYSSTYGVGIMDMEKTLKLAGFNP